MATADEVITKYTLDASGYKRGAAQVEAATLKAANSIKGMSKGSLGAAFGTALKEVGSGLKMAMPLVQKFASLYAGVTAAGAAAGVSMMRQAGEYDALVAALTAVEGSADKASGALKRVRDIARGPGLGVQEAISGYTALRRSGLGQSMSERLLREFGNANAMSGGGKAELDRVLRAVSQIATKPNLQGEELMQLTEAGIPAYKMMRDVFGTSDTEELKKKGIDSTMVLSALVRELEKMPRVAGGAKNSFDNVADALAYAGVMGGQALNAAFLPMVDSFSQAVETLSGDGTIKSAFESLAQNVLDVVGGAADTMEDRLLDAMQHLVEAGEMWRNITLNIKSVAEALSRAWKWLNTPLGGGAGSSGDEADVSPAANTQRWRDTMEMERRVRRMRSKDPGVAEDEPEQPKAQSVPSLLKSIDFNTRKTAENTDPGKNIVGGGDLARRGVTAVEMGAKGGSRRLSKAMRDLEEAITQTLEETVGLSLVSLRRSGAY